MNVNVWSRSKGLVRALWRDEGAQALIEYGLLAAIIGIAGALLFPTIAAKMATAYLNWGIAAQNAWEPCPPGGCP
jgi:Flp pilus assembly pilin Flp